MNPFPANISTRGSAESILGLMVISTLYYAIKGRWTISAILLGLSIHWKIYPLIYLGSLVVPVGQLTDPSEDTACTKLPSIWRWLTNRERVKFLLTTVISFLALGGIMYIL